MKLVQEVFSVLSKAFIRIIFFLSLTLRRGGGRVNYVMDQLHELYNLLGNIPLVVRKHITPWGIIANCLKREGRVIMLPCASLVVGTADTVGIIRLAQLLGNS
jgi:hypothetical protein